MKIERNWVFLARNFLSREIYFDENFQLRNRGDRLQSSEEAWTNHSLIGKLNFKVLSLQEKNFHYFTQSSREKRREEFFPLIGEFSCFFGHQFSFGRTHTEQRLKRSFQRVDWLDWNCNHLEPAEINRLWTQARLGLQIVKISFKGKNFRP